MKKKKIPKFKNENEERNFWDKHSPLDFPEEFEDIEIDFIDKRPKKEPVTLRIDTKLKQKVKLIANKKGIPYQTLIHMWIKEKVDKEKVAKILKE